MIAYAELQVTSNYSFLRGASHPSELVDQAAELGHTAIALTDRNTLAGVVRAHVAARETNVRLIPGARLDLTADLTMEDEHSGASFLCLPLIVPLMAVFPALLLSASDAPRRANAGLLRRMSYTMRAGRF